MPVTFQITISGHTSSNKPVKTVISQLPVYSYSLPGIGNVQVLKPLLDKINITIPIPSPKIRKQVLQALLDAESGEIGGFKKAWGAGVRRHYARAITCTVGGETILIQGKPRQPAGHFLRIEFNPSKVKANIAILRERFAKITSGLLSWAHVVQSGRVTRVDVAVDLVGAPMHDLVVLSNVPGKNHFYVGEDGLLETAYLGTPAQKKPTEQLVYDKSKQVEETGHAPQYGGISHSRVEVIVKAKNFKLSNLTKLENPLFRLAVIHPSIAPEGVDPVVWELFLEACRYRGIPGALKLIPENIRGTCKTVLDKAATACWKPDKLWSYWPKVVDESELLKTD